MKHIIDLLVMFFSSATIASDNIHSRTLYAGVPGTGTVFIHVSNSINEVVCPGNSLCQGWGPLLP